MIINIIIVHNFEEDDEDNGKKFIGKTFNSIPRKVKKRIFAVMSG